MAFKDILVHVDTREPSAERLNAAVSFAKTGGARLTGIYVKTKPHIPGYAEAHIGAEILEEQARREEEAANDAGEKFQAAVSNGLKTDWRVFEGEATEIISEQVRCYDLAIVGQCNPESKIFIGDCDLPDRLIMGSGRPILIIPYIGKYTTIGKNILVAWDGSPMAARALHDAMPLLETAKKVTLMVINPAKGNGESPVLPVSQVAEHLARHGINVEIESVRTDIDPGDMLLSRAADLSIDLIVMGAYGHARWAELVLGGVTNHMLNYMTVPVLMAH